MSATIMAVYVEPHIMYSAANAASTNPFFAAAVFDMISNSPKSEVDAKLLIAERKQAEIYSFFLRGGRALALRITLLPN